MKKQWFAGVLSILFVLTLLPTLAFAAGTLELEVSSVTAANIAGEEVAVTVSAVSNSGYGAGAIGVTWDGSVLELKGVEYTEIAPDNGSEPITTPLNSGLYRIAFGDSQATEDFTGTGAFFTLVFQVAENATDGVYTITLDDPDVNDQTNDPVTVTAQPGTVTLETPTPKVLTAIEVTTPPEKLEYTEGETFDPAGMIVTATYDDDSTAEVTDYTTEPTEPLTVNDTEITITYTEGEATVTATVAITVNPIPTYTVTFDANGGEGEMESVADITGSYTLPANGFTPPEGQQFKAWAQDSADGAQYVPGTDVTIEADTVFFAIWEEIPADQKTITGIEVTTQPDKVEYIAGETFDPAGMIVTATYEDDSTAEITGYAISPSGELTTDVTEITITYTEGGVTVTATVAVTVKEAVAYTITFDANGGEVEVESAVTDAAGKLAELPTPTRSGSYRFDGWYTAASGGVEVTTDTVFSSDATIYALWSYVGGGGGGGYTAFRLTFNTNGGSSISSITGSYGKVIDLSPFVPTREGYDFDGWYSDSALTKQVTEIRLTSNIIVYAKWKAEAFENPFLDVREGAYYYDAVLWAAENGITSGTSANYFSPDWICTRAQMVTFLWRAAGSPAVTGSTPFVDVAYGSYYYDAVCWAYSHGVTIGTSATTFSPDMTVSRAQVVTLLYRYNGAPGMTGGMPFTDVSSGAYYYDAVLWAVKNGVTTGTGANRFTPNKDCTRAEIVVFLYRDANK